MVLERKHYYDVLVVDTLYIRIEFSFYVTCFHVHFLFLFLITRQSVEGRYTYIPTNLCYFASFKLIFFVLFIYFFFYLVTNLQEILIENFK